MEGRREIIVGMGVLAVLGGAAVAMLINNYLEKPKRKPVSTTIDFSS